MMMRGMRGLAQRHAITSGVNRMVPSGIQRRTMAAGGHGPFYISPGHTFAGKAYMTICFLWILYRTKEDGMVKLLGYHPWDLHDDHGHDDHDDDEDEDDHH